ncbi:hypothetical protein G8759_31265 [Spirosoma aureum]|uniref:Peptidase S49 domain-containing protein n=1 Tax=Spirosoma aureum TaxID=2692134 RepID=A0A6G9AWR0_9BACT|nr:S49 family peptidase [Spirosoma aureum]QIP16804.1 hypothetical protein G8759_31265 [Spirosoma aureum]
MNRNFRTFSALLRTDWCIDPQYANDHLEVVNSFLTGTFSPKLFFGDEEEEDEKPLAYAVSLMAGSSGQTPSLSRHDLDDPDMPENSILVVPISGPIFKEGFCGSAGALDYAQAINEAYANPKIIGTIQLVDSPGGQLSGTPTLYDAIRNPAKPSITLIYDGMMASAALWLSVGSNKIYASQPTDQVGSAGVFVTLRDNSEAMAKAGYKTIYIYSDLSPEKNKPYREALAGNTKPMREDLNQAASHFHTAVKTGRGDRLKPIEKDGPNLFEGGMFYADEAIELGLIDGYATLEQAVAEIVELHTKRTHSAPGGRYGATEIPVLQGTTLDSTAPTDAPEAPTTGAITAEELTAPEATQPQSNQIPTDMSLFGNKHKVLSSLAGVEASEISDDQLNAVNAELDSLNIKGVRIISTTYLEQADASVAELATANTTIATITQERDNARAEAEKFGNQPGHLGSKSGKVAEATVPTAGEKLISEVDQELIDRESKIKRHD